MPSQKTMSFLVTGPRSEFSKNSFWLQHNQGLLKKDEAQSFIEYFRRNCKFYSKHTPGISYLPIYMQMKQNEHALYGKTFDLIKKNKSLASCQEKFQKILRSLREPNGLYFMCRCE